MNPAPDVPDPEIRVRETRVLWREHSVLSRTVLEHRRRDGSWQTVSRETYDRGNGAALLPFDPRRRTVLLVRQFRYPAYLNGHRQPLIEAIAGVLDNDDPLAAIRREAEEEAGLRIRSPRLVFEAFMSPGAVTERLSLFVAEYNRDDRIHAGGGLPAEGEDIEVLEPLFEDALAMVADGRIVDAKTIMLIQHLRLAGLL